jgi:acyl carrier protein
LKTHRGFARQLVLFFGVKVTNRKPISDKRRHVDLMRRWLRLEANCRCSIGKIFTVLDRTATHATDRITALVRKRLAKRSIDRPVGPDDDLIDSGLSSLDIVNLMLSVEAEFDLKISDRDMTPANFRSIARIDALVRACTRAEAVNG